MVQYINEHETELIDFYKLNENKFPQKKIVLRIEADSSNFENELIIASKFAERVIGLVLIGSNVDTISNKIGLFKGIKILSIVHTGVSRLPNAIREFDKLEFLELGYVRIRNHYNVLSTCPRLIDVSFIVDLKSLIYLSLEGCNLQGQKLPLKNLQFLELLNLKGTKIESVNPSIYQLKSLKNVNFSSNQLKSLTIAPRWEVVHAEKNKIGSIVFNKYSNRIKYLSLYDNEIYDLSFLMNSKCNQLEYLNLNWNYIHEFPYEILSFKELNILIIQCCEIGSEFRIFNNSKLRSLVVSTSLESARYLNENFEHEMDNRIRLQYLLPSYCKG